MDNDERLYLARCPYCGHTSGLLMTLEMYNSSFWCTTCSRSFKLDPPTPTTSNTSQKKHMV